MLKRSTKDQRQEVGFWIYYDPVKKQYYIGKKRYGIAVKNDGKARGNISLGDKSPSVNGVPATAKVVASFHTHTPMTEIKGMKRKVDKFDLKKIKGMLIKIGFQSLFMITLVQKILEQMIIMLLVDIK